MTGRRVYDDDGGWVEPGNEVYTEAVLQAGGLAKASSGDWLDTSEVAEQLAMALGYILDNNPGYLIGRGPGMDALDRFEEHCKP